MNLKNGENMGAVDTEIEVKEGKLRSKLKGLGSLSSKDLPLGADEIDLKSLDIQLDKQISKGLSKGEAASPKEEWEIDLSKLQIRYEVARGTFGTVYRGEYDGSDVAVKLLNWGGDEFSTEAEAAILRASFQKEVAVWHELNHPNVTKFIGASMGAGELKFQQKHPTSVGNKLLPNLAYAVVVEYLPGGTLKQFLIRNMRKKLPYKTAIQLALDLSRGLSYLHSKKIVHRDVKTENMLLDGNKNLKIADFGVARIEAPNPNDMTGETGTLVYMAPEVLDGQPYNRKCDVYSFSICLWEIYCCDMPYPNLSFVEISFAVVRQNLRPKIPKCCPSALADIMRRCWDPSPKKRPEMEEVVRLLEAIDTSKGGGMIPDNNNRKCGCLFPTCGREP